MNDTRGVFLVFSLVCLTLFIYGTMVTINSITNEKNECRMTFMFEHPNYVVSSLLENKLRERQQHASTAHTAKDRQNPSKTQFNLNLIEIRVILWKELGKSNFCHY